MGRSIHPAKLAAGGIPTKGMSSFAMFARAVCHGIAVLWAAMVLPASSLAFADSGTMDDPRQFMHGIGAARADNGDMYVFFSSSGLPPQGARGDEDWTHDVYLARWTAQSGIQLPARIFIREFEAQEPVAVAQNARGTIMLTIEDWHRHEEVTQRYGVYDSALKPVRAYPQTVEDGGHSGDIAAVGDYFVVAYSDGWIDSGGVNDLGTGNGVYTNIYDGLGKLLHNIDVAHDRPAWWPVVAGGRSVALLAWQEQAGKRQTTGLNIALVDPASGRLHGQRRLRDRVQPYAYNAAWLDSIQRFLVLGTASGQGFAKLIDSRGKVTASLSCMPATVREAGIAVQDADDSPKASFAYTPSADGRLLQLHARPDSLALSGILSATRGGTVSWQPLGSIGLFRSSGTLDWLSLTPRGLEQTQFDPAKSARPTKRELCH